MKKYVLLRNTALKLILCIIIAGIVLICSVWFMSFSNVSEIRQEDAIQLENKFSSTYALMQAPVFRTDVDNEIAHSITTNGLLTSEQYNAVRKSENVQQVYPLVGSSGDGNTLRNYSNFSGYVDGESNILIQYLPLPLDVFADIYSQRVKLVTGDFPKDNSNQVIVSNKYDYQLGDTIKVDNENKVIVGKYEARTKEVVLPYFKGAYEQLYYLTTLESFESLTNTEIANKLEYGNLLIEFKSTPTTEELNQITKIVPNSRMYYKGYNPEESVHVLYIKQTLIRNANLYLFGVFTIALLTLILLYVQYKENMILSYYKFGIKDLYKIDVLEIIQMIVGVWFLDTILYFILYANSDINYINLIGYTIIFELFGYIIGLVLFKIIKYLRLSKW